MGSKQIAAWESKKLRSKLQTNYSANHTLLFFPVIGSKFVSFNKYEFCVKIMGQVCSFLTALYRSSFWSFLWVLEFSIWYWELVLMTVGSLLSGYFVSPYEFCTHQKQTQLWKWCTEQRPFGRKANGQLQLLKPLFWPEQLLLMHSQSCMMSLLKKSGNFMLESVQGLVVVMWNTFT